MASHIKQNRPNKPRVAVGMSGGVDSSITAALLVKQGYDVTGVFLECWRAPGCRTDEDRADALEVALRLGIPFQVLDFKQRYHDVVVQYFFDEYQAGRTPNPDVLCNREIKFGLFYDWAMEHGFEYVATGHYARIVDTDGRRHLSIPADSHKDQTYFLYQLRQDQLNHVLFPLSELTKQQVRAEARRRGLPTAHKKDSVGICFIGDIDVRDFLRERLGENPGEVVNTAGDVIGRHRGLWFYTIGQRQGFEIDQRQLVEHPDGSVVTRHNLPPFYVVAKDAPRNRLVVGFGNEAYRKRFEIQEVNWLENTAGQSLQTDCSVQVNNELLVRIRHTGQLVDCALEVGENGTTGLLLHQPVKGVAPGQSAVVYRRQDTATFCLGGGVIAG